MEPWYIHISAPYLVSSLLLGKDPWFMTTFRCDNAILPDEEFPCVLLLWKTATKARKKKTFEKTRQKSCNSSLKHKKKLTLWAKLSAPTRLIRLLCLFFKAAALDGFWNKSQVSPNEFSKQLSSSGVSNC